MCSKEQARTQGLCSLRHQTWQYDLGQIPQPFAKPPSPHQKEGAIYCSYLQVRVNSIILKGFLKRIFLLFSNPQPLSWPGPCPSPHSKPGTRVPLHIAASRIGQGFPQPPTPATGSPVFSSLSDASCPPTLVHSLSPLSWCTCCGPPLVWGLGSEQNGPSPASWDFLSG